MTLEYYSYLYLCYFWNMNIFGRFLVNMLHPFIHSSIHSVHNVASEYIRIFVHVHFWIFAHHWYPGKAPHCEMCLFSCLCIVLMCEPFSFIVVTACSALTVHSIEASVTSCVPLMMPCTQGKLFTYKCVCANERPVLGWL